jgi:signal transduction histidine kinase
VTDVLESQRQAEALRNAIDVSDDAVVLYSRDRRVVFTNDAYHRIFPAAPAKDEIVGMTLGQLARELKGIGWRGPDETAVVDEETVIGGRTYLCRGRIFGNGEALTTFIDITRRKEIEAELRRLASEVSLAEERERRRITAELHDGAVQKLGVSRMRLGMLCTGPQASRDAHDVEEICDLLDRSIRELRSLMSELSSPVLYELGLEPAVEWLAQHFGARHGLEFEVDLEDEPERLSTDVEVSLFQAVRELLVNVTKHAQATKVSIGVQRSDADLQVRIEDDGIGLDPDAIGKLPSETGGFGLFSVRERLDLLGGELQIESDHGTRVTMTVPLAT